MQGPAHRTHDQKGEPWAEPNGSRDDPQSPRWQTVHCSCSPVAIAGQLALAMVNELLTDEILTGRASRLAPSPVPSLSLRGRAAYRKVANSIRASANPAVRNHV